MITVERCATGRLASTYPAGEHDVELRVPNLDPAELADILRRESGRLLDADPRCRRVVYAAAAGDVAAVSAAERAGFRYVVDVDVRGDRGVVLLSLLAREPDFVTRVDMDLDHVPET